MRPRETILKINEPVSIENGKNYSKDAVRHLTEVLVSGVAAQVDPNRKNYYDVHHGGRGFFIHVRPCRRKVLLLATWLTEQPAA